jgi:hypothetical protein
MTINKTLLFVLLAPGIAALAACAHDRDNTADMGAAESTSSSTAADTGSMSSDTGTTGTETGTSTGMGATTSGSSTTSTGSMGATGNASFSDLDRNHDGSLTRDELTSTDAITSQFSTADSNGDGKLSETEYNAAVGNPSTTPGQ